MRPKSDLWSFRLRAGAVAPFLKALGPHFALAARLDLRLRFNAGGGLTVTLPKPPSSASGADLEALRGRLAEAMAATGRLASEFERLPLETRSLEGESSLTEGALGFVLRAAVPGAAPPEDPRRRVVLTKPEGVEAFAKSFAAVVRRGGGARFVVGEGGVALFDLLDDPDRGSMLEGLRAEGEASGAIFLRPSPVAGFSLWLPEDLAFEAGDPTPVETLNALAEAGLLERGTPLHLLWRGEEDGLFLLAEDDQAADAADLATKLPPPDPQEVLGPALSLRLMRIAPHEAALQALTARLGARDFPLGYRMSLAPIPERSRLDRDVERLRAEIEEREEKLALLQALSGPQMRLLRFTDAQLPALADGLRKMPSILRENRGLLYAAAHAADRAEPAHFVLYDPDAVRFEDLSPEHYWRAVTEDSPIGYWLDPHAEEARRGAPEEPAVFTPVGHRLTPCLDSFGETVSGALRLSLGGLFADASAVLEAPDAKPAFVFTGPSGGGDEIRVELIDLARFGPLRASLRWINEHLLASSPRVADPEALRELAESLYAGALAQEMRAEAETEVVLMRSVWDQSRAEILHGFDELTEAAAREVSAVQRRFEEARAFLAMAQTRLAEVEGAVDALGAALGGAEGALEAMALQTPNLAERRFAFMTQHLAQTQAGERLMRDAEQEIETLRAQMAALVKRLEEG